MNRPSSFARIPADVKHALEEVARVKGVSMSEVLSDVLDRVEGKRRERRYTVKELAEIWQVSAMTVRRWIAANDDIYVYNRGKRGIRVRETSVKMLEERIGI